MDGFHIQPDDLRSSANTLGTLAQDIGKGGQQMRSAGEALVQHASGDSSGVGSVIAKAFGKALTTTGDVFSQASRLGKGSSDRLHANADAHEETERSNTSAFRGIHSDTPSGGTRSKSTGSEPTGGGESTGGAAYHGSKGPKGGGGEGGGESTSGASYPGSKGAKDPGSIAGSNTDPAHNSTPTKDLPGCGDPVDIATGRVFLRQTDVELRAAHSLVFTRTHLSTYRSGRSFGPSWASTVDARVETGADGVDLAAADGMLLHYPLPGDTEEPVLPDTGPRWPLRRTAAGYAVTDPASAETWLFPATGPVGAIVPNAGGRIDIERDTEGTPVRLVHSAGYQVDVESVGGRITALRLGDTELAGYGYDEAGNLASVVNSSGRALTFGYDAQARITAWQDRNGVSYAYTYDAAGRCVHTESAEGYLRYDYDYDRENLVTTATNSLGHRTGFHLNEALQVVREVDPLGAETKYQWDSAHRLLSEVDPLGGTTCYEYDESGDLRVLTRADGTQEVTGYDERHRPVTVTDPDGAVWQQEYGPRGELAATVDPVGARTSYGYDSAGHLVTVTDGLGGTTRFVRNGFGLVTAVTEPTGARTEYRYDTHGRVISVTDPTGQVTRFGWTTEGLPSTVAEPDGGTRTWRYDGEGNLREQRDPEGRATLTEVAHFDLPVARTAPDGSRQEYRYDTELQLVAVRDERGAEWTYRYDAAGNLVEENDFDGRVLRYEYDLAGNLVRRENGAGETIEFTRDALGRVVAEQADGVLTRIEYDPAGRLLAAVNPDADLRFGYDPRGLVLTETCNGRTVASEYDLLGRRSSRTLPSGTRSDWTYDAAGQPTGVRVGGHALELRKDAAGRDLGRSWGQVGISHTWDGGGRLTAQTVTAPDGVVQRRGYSYRPDGLLTGVQDARSGTRAFELDPLGRITGIAGEAGGARWQENYAYDNTGNPTAASWPGADPAAGVRTYRGTQLSVAGATAYQHDAQGRQTVRSATGPDGTARTWEFSWTASDRMAAVTTPDGQRWRYRYDALGRRIAKQRLGQDDAVVEQVDFTWDGDNLTEEHHSGAGGRFLRAWELEPGTDLPLLQWETGPDQAEVDARFYAIVTDLVGTPTDLIAPDGRVLPRLWQTVWGRAAADGDPTPLRFPGQYYDAETGLHYNVHRYYDPATGRYTSPDPLGLAGGPNPRSYVRNPLAWYDPLGLTPDPSCGKGGQKGGRGKGGRGGGSGGSGSGGTGGGAGGGRNKKRPSYYDNPLASNPVASVPTSPENPTGKLYHYTDANGEQAIPASGHIRPSEWSPTGEAANGHARYGSGAYLTDVPPGHLPQDELSRVLVLNPSTGHRFTHYVEVDPQQLQGSGYSIAQAADRPHVFVAHQSGEPLNQGGPSNVDVSGNSAITGHGGNWEFPKTDADAGGANSGGDGGGS